MYGDAWRAKDGSGDYYELYAGRNAEEREDQGGVSEPVESAIMVDVPDRAVKGPEHEPGKSYVSMVL